MQHTNIRPCILSNKMLKFLSTLRVIKNTVVSRNTQMASIFYLQVHVLFYILPIKYFEAVYVQANIFLLLILIVVSNTTVLSLFNLQYYYTLYLQSNTINLCQILKNVTLT